MEPYRLLPGKAPLLVSVPHAGTYVPDTIRARFTPEAQELPDTDWHVDRLYEFVQELDIPCLIATHSRYVVDLDRPPDNTALGQGPTTGLIPTTLFDGDPIYRDGREPDRAERQQRIDRYHRPYHERLMLELASIREQYGYALLFDAHSIRSRVPRLFEGELAALNLGSNAGNSAAPNLIDRAMTVCRAAGGFRCVLDERFKGGYITRHYGKPHQGIHALQLELAQRTYMQETPPFPYRWLEDRAAQIRPVLRTLLISLRDWRPS